MLECELYLVIAISTGSLTSWVDTVFFPVSCIPSECVKMLCLKKCSIIKQIVCFYSQMLLRHREGCEERSFP